MGGAAIPLVNLEGCEKPMPVVGMGTALLLPAALETTKDAVLETIRAGYRHLDTAFAYGTKKPLGQAVAEVIRLGLVASRDDLFITTKLWASCAEPSQIVPACKMSLQNLGMEYVDLYLIHWPVRLTEMLKTTPVSAKIVKHLDMKGAWEAMEECKNLGLAIALTLVPRGKNKTNTECRIEYSLRPTSEILLSIITCSRSSLTKNSLNNTNLKIINRPIYSLNTNGIDLCAKGNHPTDMGQIK